MTPFNTDFDPPAITVPIKVAGAVQSRPRAQLIGLLDTGADVTAIPATLKDRYKLYPIGRLQLEGIDGITSTVYTYEANLTVFGQPARTMEVILTHFPFVVLGRDWLEQYHLQINGPEQSFEFSLNPFT